jgi:hypothetical protein
MMNSPFISLSRNNSTTRNELSIQSLQYACKTIPRDQVHSLALFILSFTCLHSEIKGASHDAKSSILVPRQQGDASYPIFIILHTRISSKNAAF